MLSEGDRQRVSIVGFDGNQVDRVDRLEADLEQALRDIKMLSLSLVQLDDYCRRQEEYERGRIESLESEVAELRGKVANRKAKSRR